MSQKTRLPRCLAGASRSLPLLRRTLTAGGAAFVCALAGCSIPFQLGVGPTVDTTGAVGVEAKMSVGLSLFDERGGIAAQVAGGASSADATRHVAVEGELFALPHIGKEHLLRIGLLGGARWDMGGGYSRTWAEAG